MNQPSYDTIGNRYSLTRFADPRITSIISDLLNLPKGATVTDIGAGTGNYSNALAKLGYNIIAIEPSVKMIKQASFTDNVSWLPGFAESIPLADNAVDGVIIVLALHHFLNLVKTVQELCRICPGGLVVVFTMDYREGEKFWFYDYLPEIARQVKEVFPPLKEVIRLFYETTGWSAVVKPFPLPCDLADRFMCSGWHKPELYFDKQFRDNTSGFALASPAAVKKGLALLQSDLSDGTWDKNYGSLRNRDSFDAGYRFIKFERPGR